MDNKARSKREQYILEPFDNKAGSLYFTLQMKSVDNKGRAGTYFTLQAESVANTGKAGRYFTLKTDSVDNEGTAGT